MPNPPFRAAPSVDMLRGLYQHGGDRAATMPRTENAAEPAGKPPSGPASKSADEPAGGAASETGRARFGTMDPHLHCSVIGTCLSTGELRKAMSRFIQVEGASDLDIHHEAVRLAQRSDIAHALNKLLDRKHEATVQRFGRAKDADQLAELWREALANGDVPGTYWAVLTHRRVPPDLRQQVFGDVHMLSHLVGAANRADIRRLVAIEQESSELQRRNLRQQERIEELAGERDREQAENLALRSRIEALEHARDRDATLAGSVDDPDREALAAVIATQTQRRESAESRLQALENEARRLASELDKAREQAATLSHELSLAEAELRRGDEVSPTAAASPFEALAGRRLLYVGGRPSSSPAIRDVVTRHGAEYQRHDGGIEDRKGQLAPAIAWADLVVFPVDCVDHDSALQLKRLCTRQGTTWLALRSASVASLAAGLAGLAEVRADASAASGAPCLRNR